MGAGTQEAITEQLRLGQELRRKVEWPDTESEDESGSSASDVSDEEEDAEGAGARPHSRRAAAKMKAAALDIISGELEPVLHGHIVAACLLLGITE
jgi:hypothetical protein